MTARAAAIPRKRRRRRRPPNGEELFALIIVSLDLLALVILALLPPYDLIDAGVAAWTAFFVFRYWPLARDYFRNDDHRSR